MSKKSVQEKRPRKASKKSVHQKQRRPSLRRTAVSCGELLTLLDLRLLDLRPADALGGHQLADPLAGIEHACLHRVGRHRNDLGDLLDRLLVVVDEVDDLAM